MTLPEGMKMSTKVKCPACQGTGLGRYPPDVDTLQKCRSRGCNGKGTVTLRQLNHMEWA